MGGGVMRAAAKVAGISATRGFAANQHPLSSAARRAVSIRPPAATVEDVKLVSSATQPSSDIGDWIFAGEEEIAVRNGEPMPRVIFGGVPTFHEAEEATSELSAALEKANVSSPNSAEDIKSGLVLSNNQLVGESGSSLPASAVMAFRFLNESPGVQNVVASVASDPNVWYAVLQNPEVQDYLKSDGVSPHIVDSVPDDESSARINGDSYSSEDKNFFDSIKSAVYGMVNKLSDYFGNLFGGNGDKEASADGFKGSFYENAPKMVFGLAVMVIALIVLKRAA